MTNARSLANFATGIGTEGAVLTVDNTNNRIGIATTNPQNDLQVGLGITMEGDTGQVTFVGIVTAEGFRNSDGSVVGAASTDNIITGTAATFTSDVNIADSIIHVGDTNTKIRFPAADTFTVETAGSERVRVTSAGLVGIGTAAGSSSSSRLVVYEESGNAQTIEVKAKNTGGVGAQPGIRFTAPNNDNIGAVYGDVNSDSLKLATGTVERVSINSSGNVGIATTNPLGRLSLLADDSQADADIVFQTLSGIGLAHAALSTTDDSGGTDLMVGSNFYLSTNGAETRFATGRSGTAIRFGYSGTMRFYTNSGSNAPTERLRIASNGSVGFNTTLTSGALTVNIAGDYKDSTQNVADEGLIFQSFTTASTGDVYPGISWTGNPTALGRARASITAIATNDNAGSDLLFLTRNAADGTELDVNDDEKLRITSAGRVGIGSQTPARKLDVNGVVRVIETIEGFDTSGGSTDWFVSSASFGFHNGTGVAFNAGGGLFRLGISGSEKVRVDVGGNVNITGITTASQFDATSDVALKENIEVIDEPITKISELKGVTFDWKKGGHSVGVIAQDVEKVLPTAVGGSKDQKTVNYNAIIGLLVESVKDQQKQIEELKSLLDK